MAGTVYVTSEPNAQAALLLPRRRLITPGRLAAATWGEPPCSLEQLIAEQGSDTVISDLQATELLGTLLPGGRADAAHLSAVRTLLSAASPAQVDTETAHPLLTLARDYAHALQEQGWQDLSAPNGDAAPQALLFHGYTDFTSAQARFLTRAATPESAVILPNLSGSAAPEMLAALGWTLRRDADVPRAPLTVLTANDRLHEARTVMRLAAEHLRRHPDETVIVVVRVPEAYRTDFTLAAREQQLPVAFCTPQMGTQTPAGRLLLLIARVLLSHWDYEDVCALLAHPELPELSSAQWTHIRELGPRTQRSWSGLLPHELRSLEQLQEQGTPAAWYAALQPLSRTWPALAALLSAAALPATGNQHDLGAALAHALQQPLQEEDQYASGRVLVAPPEAICGARADFVCMVGLSEGVWPASPQFPPVLDAHDRAALRSAGWNLPTTSTHAAREQALFWWAGHAAPEVTVLYPHFVEGRPRPASELISAEVDSAACAPPAAWPAVPLLRQDDPPPFPEPAFDVLELPLSATQLTRFGQCAFHWFAQHGLGLKERDEPSATLAPHVRGKLYHHTLELVTKQLAQTPDAPLDDLVEQSFAAAEAAERLGRLPNWLWQRQEHLHHLRGLTRSPDFLPGDFRVHRSELAFTTEWCGLTVTGQIDRLDVEGEGEDARYAVTDYKSGSSRPKGALGAGGQLSLDVQLPIYLAAAGEYTGTAVTSGRYLSVTRREKRVLAEAAPDFAGLEALAAAFEDAADSGLFPVNPDEQQEACTFCPYTPLCRRTNSEEENDL